MKRGLYRIGIGPELMQCYDPIARHCERGEAERGNLKSTPTLAGRRGDCCGHIAYQAVSLKSATPPRRISKRLVKGLSQIPKPKYVTLLNRKSYLLYSYKPEVIIIYGSASVPVATVNCYSFITVIRAER